MGEENTMSKLIDEQLTIEALDAVASEVERLSPEAQRAFRLAVSARATHGPRADELSAIFGGRNWVLAPRSKGIVARYGEDVICVSRKQYAAAEREAIERRFPR
jgi:hypothetical protein